MINSTFLLPEHTEAGECHAGSRAQAPPSDAFVNSPAVRKLAESEVAIGVPEPRTTKSEDGETVFSFNVPDSTGGVDSDFIASPEGWHDQKSDSRLERSCGGKSGGVGSEFPASSGGLSNGNLETLSDAICYDVL